MSIWKQPFNLDTLNTSCRNTMVEATGIEFIEFGDNYLKASMPVDHRTVQPMRILHGGANVVLAETLGSVASILCLDDMNSQGVIGVEINANHLRSAYEGSVVYGTVTPVRVGRTLHVWQIEIRDAEEQLLCTSRLTTMVASKK